MGKRKSAKPQKYVQQSDEDDEDHLDYYDEMDESENIETPSISKKVTTSEKNLKALWPKEKPPELTNDVKTENNHTPIKGTVESDFWASHFPLNADGVSNSNNKKFDFNNFKVDSSHSVDNFRESSRSINQGSPLETLLSERIYNSNPFLEERLRESMSMNHNRNLSGTESDRISAHDMEYDRRGSRPKRRRKYVTYPATFRLEVVTHAERYGKSAAAKKYNICVEKVSMWCKTKDNIVHKVKKGTHPADGSFDTSYDERTEDLSMAGTPERTMDDEVESTKEIEEEKRQQISQELEMLYNDESDASDKYEGDALRRPEIVFPPFFKYRVTLFAEKKSEKEASREFHVCEKRVAIWCQAKEYLAEYVNAHKVEEWEIDLYVNLKKLLEENYQVTVRDLIVRAEQAQLASSSTKSTISTVWLTDWCQKFKVCFRSVLESTPQPLTENTCLILETSHFQLDREELQIISLRSKKSTKVQDIIDSTRTLDASPSTSDREDSFSSFSFNSKRRRRSYTLAFKLEVVKFAQSNTKHATSRKYGIARRVISRWIADKEVLQTDLLNATQHVLGSNNMDDDVDVQLLKWYREVKKKGQRVTKSLLFARANTLFEQQSTPNSGPTKIATSSWYRHWLVKCKDLGEDIQIEEDSQPSASSTLPATQTTALDLQNRNSEGSSLNALKQAYMTNAILSTMKPTEMDLKLMTQFPELLNAIQQNPSIINAAAHMQAQDSDFYKACSSLQAVMNLCKDRNSENNSLNQNFPYLNHVSEIPLADERKNISNMSVKKRRERYSPDFKLMVIDYAASHSYQETSRKFGVHHITVSEWCKDKDRIRKKVYCENLQNLHTKILKSETAEQKFLSWIQDCNKNKIIIKPTDVQNKANEILNIIGEAEVKKKCWWFYLWNKRGMEPGKLYEEDSDVLEKESRVNYPPAVKVEIAKVAERQSANCAARCFRVARKRIREWVKSKDKLKWLAETGQVRERGGSLCGQKINCLDVDKEVFDWYSSSRTSDSAPQLQEIRSKALEIFQKHGFSNMKCSKEWYRNWCKRYGICRSLQKDNQLIKWILSRYDKNLPITNQELVEYVISEKMKTGVELNDQPAEEYVLSFCKRYPRLLEALPSVGETFPEEMEAEVNKFRCTIKELQEENNFSMLAIGSMDEIPLLFTSSGNERRVIVNSGVNSCNAVVILSCLADGAFLPPMIVLKSPEDSPISSTLPHVVFREKVLVDHHLVKQWADEVWLSNVPSPSMLLMDCSEPHMSSSVQEAMLESGITPVIMPDGCASKLQPLGACITRNFQELVREIWNSSRSANPAGPPSKAASNTYVPSPGEVSRCVVDAFDRLRDQRDLVRRSFVVTGIAVAADGSEDALVENMDWFGCSSDEHVLSPASDSEPDSLDD